MSSMARNNNEKLLHMDKKQKYGRILLYVTATSVNGTKYSSYFPVHRMAIFLHLNAQPIATEHHASHICVSVPRFSPHHTSLET